MKKKLYLVLITFLFILFGYQQYQSRNSLKLYWFIPDGVRAEPSLFNIYKWAEQGKLPNIKKMMDRGTYGFSKPTFPSHTPTNFATLFTGTYPEVHGVDDGPMRVIGKPLDKVAVAGFRSSAKKVKAIWSTLEDSGNEVALISIPGSTPPEINSGLVLRGRWGGWGADYHAINFESKGDLTQRVKQGRGSKLFFFGPQLTQYIDSVPATGWKNPPTSYSEPLEITLEGWGSKVYGYIYDSVDDSRKKYNRVAFSLDKENIFSRLQQHEWSEWTPITLKWDSAETSLDVKANVRATVIKLDEDGFFRVRLFYDNLNQYNSQPAEASEIIHKEIGPMADFVDNFPPQLIYYAEDKQTFIDEAKMTLDWHKDIVSVVADKFTPDVVIHDTYTPNQMLTSRWWMSYIDPNSSRYNEVSDDERDVLWEEVSEMYLKLDDIIGEILSVAGKNTYVVFSSDHGAVPLDRWVNLNNLFAQKGWLKFDIDKTTGEPKIDWENSQVIYLKMAHVYINPDGLSGDYQRASGKEYEKLRNEVIETLQTLRDDSEDGQNGPKPVVDVVKWEDAKEFMNLDPERVGDLVIANEAGYGWNEEMSADLAVFSTPLKSGYKQAIVAEDHPGMWTPFMMMGPKVKKHNFLGNDPINHVDQYPTIMKAIKENIPEFVQGDALQIFKIGL